MYTKTINKTDQKSNQGFTLIEMSFVILILGMMVTMFAQSWSIYVKKQAAIETETEVTSVSSAMTEFRALHGRYPCPASILAAPNTAAYGREDCTIADFGNDYANTAPGVCVGGACIRESLQVVSYINPFTNTPVTQQARVRIGGVPFRELNIAEETNIDGYGNRLMYAVTEHLTFADSFTADTGGIDVWDEQLTSILPTPGSAHYMVYSTGENEAGAISRAGQIVEACPPVTALEHANCSPSLSIAVFSVINHNEGNTFKKFDDVAAVFTETADPWMLSEFPGNEEDTVLRNPIQKTGFNTDRDTTLLQEVHIQGALRARDDLNTTGVGANEGLIMSEEICDDVNETKCFKSALIGGIPIITTGFTAATAAPVPATLPFQSFPFQSFQSFGLQRVPTAGPTVQMQVMQPAQAQFDYVISVTDVATKLSGASLTGTQVNVGGGLWCPPGSYISAIKDGAPVCTTEIKQECPAGFFMSGTDASGNIICDTPPLSNCTATTEPLCGSNENLPAASHGTQHTIYAGHNASQVYECSDGTWVPFGSQQGQCTCTEFFGDINTVSCMESIWPCGFKFSGTKDEQVQTICIPGQPPQTTTVTLTNNCACEPTTKIGSQNCPSGYNQGFVSNINTHICSATPQCSGAVVTGNTCTCVPENDTRWTNCPQYYSGQYQEQQDFVCNGPVVAPGTGPTGSWSGWAEVPGQTQLDNCTCNQGGSLSATVVSCQQAGSVNPASPLTNYDATYTVGNVTFPRTINCTPSGPEVVTDWTNPTDTCAQPPPPICHWVATGGTQQSVTPSHSDGDLCTCGQFPTTSICNIGSSNYLCNCE